MDTIKNLVIVIAVFFDVFISSAQPQQGIQWQKCLGGSGYDESEAIYQTLDGGYIVAGNTASNDGNVNGNHGINDVWVVKLNSAGTIQVIISSR